MFNAGDKAIWRVTGYNKRDKETPEGYTDFLVEIIDVRVAHCRVKILSSLYGSKNWNGLSLYTTSTINLRPYQIKDDLENWV